jgi:transposase-like protein
MDPNASSPEKRSRRTFSPEEKISALREHFLAGKPISEVCQSRGIHPALFYQWQKTFFDNGGAAFAASSSRIRPPEPEKKVQKLEAVIAEKNEVIAEIMSAHVALKKSLGET